MATIGLRDVHYALLTKDDFTEATYEAPVKVAGAISANVNPNPSSATLFADDGPYDSAATLGEIELELNMADLPPAVQAVMLGHTYSGGLLIRRSTDTPPWLAIGYRSLKSNGHYRYTWLYKGKFSEAEQENQTKGDSIEWKTPTITGAFVRRDFDDAWQVEAESDDPEAAALTTDWFRSVVGTNTTGGIALSQTAVTLAIGGTKTITASGATTPTWASSNDDVATVSNGTITAVASGTAIITCTEGTKAASCTVTVL